MAGIADLMIGSILVVAAGLLVGLGGSALLRRLPEPVPPTDADEESRAEYLAKISYRSLATRRFGVVTGVLAAVAMALAVATQPVAYWAVWLGFGTVAVLLAAIDARTTWLPGPVMRLGWIVTAAAVAGCLAADPNRLPMAFTIGSGVLIAGGGYLLIWLISRGRSFAFGDVRLMPLVGAVAGTMGWSGLYWSLLLGSIVGAIVGIVRLAGRRPGPFPYGPALICGPYAAAFLISVLR